MTLQERRSASELDQPAPVPRSREPVSPVPSRSLVRVDAQPVATDIYELLDDPQIPWTDWSISGALAIELAAYLERSRPRRVLEIGSGVSTVILAAYARRHPADDIKVTTLEHKWAYHRKTERALKELGLAGCVDLHHARLRRQPFNTGGFSRSYAWYDVQLQGSFDFVFVDGPPMKKGREVVYFAIADHLAEGWEIWLDDGRRDHESRCVDLWKEQFPGRFSSCTRKDIDDKGVWILRQRPDDEKLFDVGILADGDTKFLEQVIKALKPCLRDGGAIVQSNAGRGSTAQHSAFSSEHPTNLLSTYNERRSYPTQEPRDQAIHRELLKLVQERRVEYVLYLQQFWLTRTLDDDWLGQALEVFRQDPTIEQIQLRHQIDKVAGRWRHGSWRQDKPRENGFPPFDAPIALEPSLIRADALRRCLPKEARSGDDRQPSSRRLRTVNLSPGVFSRAFENGRFLWVSTRDLEEWEQRQRAEPGAAAAAEPVQAPGDAAGSA
jgi:predicted O-methyltransferase YrrM